jgi:putative photosynthetic complex assembly protein
MSAIDKEPFPRTALIGAALIIAVAIGAAAIGRQANLAAERSAVTVTQTPLAARDLTFTDAADGSIIVSDGTHDVVLEPGADGFVRGVMRAMARHRRVAGVEAPPTFRLAQWPDGRLSLQDLATGRTIELSGFGADNRKAFARLLIVEPAA